MNSVLSAASIGLKKLQGWTSVSAMELKRVAPWRRPHKVPPAKLADAKANVDYVDSEWRCREALVHTTDRVPHRGTPAWA